MARVRDLIPDMLLAQRGTLFPFAPVCLGTGIGLYFALRVEPPIWMLASLAVAGAGLLVWHMRSTSAYAPVICAVAMVALGLELAGTRAHLVAGPVIDWRYYGPVTGRVVDIDRSASDALRITLDRVWLTNVPLAETPTRVRLSLHSKILGIAPEPGQTISTTAHLGPPGGAVEPGGFDFRRHAWFLRLGAVGYTRVPLVLWEEAGHDRFIFQTRMAISSRVQTALPGETGAFATAIITGDRSAIPQPVLQALRDTNLAHLLAISGLHMGLVSAFAFAVLRLGLLLTPIGQRWPIKKIAAAGALVVAAVYLALSGGNVATERAFVMVAVMLLAIMVDRRAISLRAVALAAMIVLALRPEAMIGPGFQMSFAATTALVAVFGAIRDSRHDLPRHRILRGVASVVMSSAVAGAATAPFAMAHFNQIAQFGLVANLLTVPLMGILVIPAAVLGILLMPFGLEALGLIPMGLGLEWILHIAQSLALWDGAVRPVMTPGTVVLPLITLGGLFVVLWQGRARLLGLVPLCVAVALWINAERPKVLVAEGGALVGVMTDRGRALSRSKGSGFIAEVWLENDGQGLDQRAAAALWNTQNMPIQHIHGKRNAESYRGCTDGSLVIASADLPDKPKAANCAVFDAAALKGQGSLSITYTDTGTWQIEKARDRSGARLWNDETLRQAQ
ncbi:MULTISPECIES: ComEC/Rec2 family competence protein [Marivita]|uniref:ComEC/Rec2 family competence protein n=1 Tax=Marivita cryptomonadis TaxID=505252 RepID=A0A9Q2NTT5_9RHOB|nr:MULTISPECIES: ComEC/Rec2 family competence protein [Marivita]MCR9167904.1 ComEC family competence protein [Paracoccaceae bacterium]MBM2322723.1 ComEC/Rec2 family competence protein [Marivita cryptomonadis]MBM2332305.1 ComEC/Rec2 family competence protein [Marivita cryptomonadis]MBM2341889.1 ComEC/Rec2 family competence protein [Marivita cryptomonadis]MBM2346553.1 ComEC/Rec2 family competence protein [Marivita cryptomonadis]